MGLICRPVKIALPTAPSLQICDLASIRSMAKLAEIGEITADTKIMLAI
jgi:hypothetical protein